MSIEFNLYGFPALYDDFKKLNYADQKLVLTRALRAGAEPIAERISAIAPADTGNLQREIISTMAGTKSDIYEASILIGASTKAFYSGFQELGTAFAPSQPHIGPAFISEEDTAIQNMADVIDKETIKRLSA